MKKTLLLFACLSLYSIYWCLPYRATDLTFEQSLVVLQNQNRKLIDKYSMFFDYTGVINQVIAADISSSNNESPTDVSIKSILSLDWQQNYNSNTDYYISMFNRSPKQQIISSWRFFYSNIEYIPYFKLDSFNLDMWTWNIESKFIQELLLSTTNKWIMIDIQNKKNFIQDYVDVAYLLKDAFSINNCQSFYKIKNAVYKSKVAYEIWLNLKNIESCLNKPLLDYTWIVFDWFIAPIGKNEVYLEIKKLQIPHKKWLIIDWTLDRNTLKININNTTTKQISKITIKYNTKHDKISLESQYYSFLINIDKISNGLDFDWNIWLSPSNLKQPKINFGIKWNLALQNTWYLDIKAPQNYIIMSQLLWDNFSLKSLVGQQ